MPRIAPSTKIREEITRLLQDGVPEGQDVVGTLLRLGAQRLAQELLEEEATDFLGRDRYVHHRGVEPHRGYRGILKRHGLQTRWERLTRLEVRAATLLTEHTRRRHRTSRPSAPATWSAWTPFTSGSSRAWARSGS